MDGRHPQDRLSVHGRETGLGRQAENACSFDTLLSFSESVVTVTYFGGKKRQKKRNVTFGTNPTMPR